VIAPRRGGTPRVIVLMGVSGSGKSTIGKRLSRTLGWPFRDADSFHPPANVEKMSRGIPLTDEDRAPWLAAIADWIDECLHTGEPGIVSCSALKRSYRRVLIGKRTGVALVYLHGSFALISDRMSRRKGHFMPTALLQSQFETLQEPSAAEHALALSVHLPPKVIVERILEALSLEPVRRVLTQ
jgi:carbohydrate kinase (thermoresistant glucokinase family)